MEIVQAFESMDALKRFKDWAKAPDLLLGFKIHLLLSLKYKNLIYFEKKKMLRNITLISL